jgi:hypothetical protein
MVRAGRKETTTMRRNRIALLAAPLAVAALLGLAAPASAGTHLNGLTLNGVKLNALNNNAIMPNALTANAFT